MSDTKKKKSTTKKSQSISREVFLASGNLLNDSDGYIEDLHALCTSKSKGITLNSVRSRCCYSLRASSKEKGIAVKDLAASAQNKE